jgi:regulator of replication initiation timing
MDDETVKEVKDLQRNLTDLLYRKRKREDAALEDENKRLNDENERLKDDNRDLNDNTERLEQRLESSAKECSQANLELGKVKQRNSKLTAENERLKNEMRQQVSSKISQGEIQKELHKNVAKQAQIIETQLEEARLLKLKNESLLTRLEYLDKAQVASKKVISDSKVKLRLAIDIEFKRLVSHHIKVSKAI